MHPALLLIPALAITSVGTEGSPPSTAIEATSSYFEDAGASASGRLLSPVGLFPIWENTAAVLGRGHVFVGTQLLGVGIGDRVQVGTHPLRDALKTPNLHAKFLLYDAPQLRVAAHLEVLWMLVGASEAFTVSNFTSRWSTEKEAYWVAPLGVTATWAPRRNLFVHFTATAQGVASRELPGPQVTFGLTGQLEWRPFQHHAFAVHATEVGLHQHDFWQVATSYRYQRWIFEGSFGLAIRNFRDGTMPFPMATWGVSL